MIEEQNADNNETARNVYGKNLITRETYDKIVVYAYNGHSDVVAICNVDGDALVTYEYDEFGNVTAETDVDEEFANFDNPYRYAGYEYLEKVKLYDLSARYYNPKIARFLSADPYYNLGNRIIGLYEIKVPNAWSIIQANNLFAYCGNSPIISNDMNGHSATATWGSSMWWLTGLDGPIPIGDIIYFGGIVVTATVDVGVIVYAKQSKKSGKEKAKDIPSWAKGKKPKKDEDGKKFAKRLMDEKYGDRGGRL